MIGTQLYVVHHTLLTFSWRQYQLVLYIWHTSYLIKLEQLERLRSEDIPRRLMITHTIESYWIPSKKNIGLELKTLQSGNDFQSQGRMTLKM